MKNIKTFDSLYEEVKNKTKKTKEYFIAIKTNSSLEVYKDTFWEKTNTNYIDDSGITISLEDGEKLLKKYDISWIDDIVYSSYVGEGNDGGNIKSLNTALSKFNLFAYEIQDYDPWMVVLSNKKLTKEQVNFLGYL